MQTHILSALAATGAALLYAVLVFPGLLKLSLRWGLTDTPGGRKSHTAPVPVTGGIGILLTLLLTAATIPGLRAFVATYPAVAAGVLIIAATGIVDDRINMDARKRLMIELCCSLLVAGSGIRICSLHGFMGINVLPVALQYLLTIVVISGVTNAFNLLDGIDGLAGSIALINCLMLGVVSFLLHQYEWGLLMLSLSASLLVFLRYNWQPARMFMGDGGSLLLGFVMSIAAIRLLQTGTSEGPAAPYTFLLPTLFSACFMIPVADTLRVVLQRVQAGRSPFSADRTHLHHKLIVHFLRHKDASRKIIALHLLLIFSAILLCRVCSVSAAVLLQVLVVTCYTANLDFAQHYSRWYRRIKRMESDN